MNKLVFAAVIFAAGPALAQDTAPAVATTAVATKISAEEMARDPRMIAAIRHANVTADHKCGETVGGITDLATKADAQRCRRRMVETAKLDAQGEIEGH